MFDSSLECNSVFSHIEISHILTGERNATIEVITPKIYKAELWFLCMTHCLIVLCNCMKFHLNSFNGSQLTEWTRTSIANDQRKIPPKISRAELWFLCMTHCLIVLYKCMKFQPNSFKSVQLTERTRNCIYLCYKGNNLFHLLHYVHSKTAEVMSGWSIT